jgi:hypothetical protein
MKLNPSGIHKEVGPLLIKQINPGGSMGEIVHTSRIKIVREKGPTRRAMIEGFLYDKHIILSAEIE